MKMDEFLRRNVKRKKMDRPTSRSFGFAETAPIFFTEDRTTKMGGARADPSEDAALVTPENFLFPMISGFHPDRKELSANMRNTTKRRAFELWTEKYRPDRLSSVIGNRKSIETLSIWMKYWSPRGEKVCVLLVGPPGVGKTTVARLCSEEWGYTPIETNASDLRSASEIKRFLGEVSTNNTLKSSKFCIVMDEIDGQGGGAIAEVVSMCSRTRVPIICIANDYYKKSLRSLKNAAMTVKFWRVGTSDACSLMKRVLNAENIESPSDQVLQNLAVSLNNDLRACLNNLQFLLSRRGVILPESVGMDRRQESVWAVVDDVFSHMGIDRNLENYFSDTFMVPAFVQENYLRMVGSFGPGEVWKAADSMSRGDVMRNTMMRTNDFSISTHVGVALVCVPGWFIQGEVGRKKCSQSLGQRRADGALQAFSQRCDPMAIRCSAMDALQYYMPTILIRQLETEYGLKKFERKVGWTQRTDLLVRKPECKRVRKLGRKGGRKSGRKRIRRNEPKVGRKRRRS